MLERKVWLRTARGNLYPNLYTILTGPPGVGKSVVLSTVAEFFRQIKGLHIAPSSVSKASLIDALKDSTRSVINMTASEPYLSFNSLFVVSSELGVLIPGYDNEFMNTLTDLYDCNYYAERKRTNSLKFEIKAPQINLIAGTTPGYLKNMMPEGAWDQGFASRVMFVYAGQQVLTDFFDETDVDVNLKTDLSNDLGLIADRIGPMRLSAECQEVFMRWHKSGGPPAPDHPKLQNYLTRRSVHLLKLMMIAANARAEGDQLLIGLPDYQTALNWLIETEAQIPDIFRSMTGGGDSNVMEELWHFVFKLYGHTKQPVPEHRLMNFLRERVPSHNCIKVIEIMVRSEMLVVSQDPKTFTNVYAPAARQH